MPRPSRNLDRALIAAGQALFPQAGCAGLTIRQVADAAGVNIGMFHYHFRTREAFLRAVMQATYDEMFSQLTLEVARPRAESAIEHLRAALRVLGRFVRDHRKFIARLLADYLSGEPLAREFVVANFPRHFQVMAGLVAEGQKRGTLRPMPIAQALGFCAGSLSMPLVAVGAVIDAGTLPRAAARALDAAVLCDSAIDQRIDLALAALAAPAPAAKKGRKK